MTATKTGMPSRKLLFLLVVSLMLAGVTVGRSYLAGSTDDQPEEFFETFDPLVGSGTERVVADEWEPPLIPRDPFVQVDIGGPPPTDDPDDPDDPDTLSE